MLGRFFCTIQNDLLIPFADPMSLLEDINFDHEFSPNGSKRTSSNLACVNPQYTDKRYGTLPPGFMTPEPSPTDATPRHESTYGGTYFSDSSESSFSSHSGCGNLSQLTPGSSASDSRRQSMILAEDQYYLSATSSSPSICPQGPKKAATTDQFPLHQYSHGSCITSTDAASLVFDGSAACTPRDGFTMSVDSYARKTPRQWQSCGLQDNASSSYERPAQPAQIDESTMFGRDLVAVFGSIAAGDSHTFEPSQPLFAHTQPAIFERTALQPSLDVYDPTGNCSTNAPSLAPALEWGPRKYDTDVGLTDDDIVSSAATAGQSYYGDMMARQPLNDSSHQLKIRWRETLSPPSDHDLDCGPSAPSILKTRNRKHRQGQRAAFASRQLDNAIIRAPHGGPLFHVPRSKDAPAHKRNKDAPAHKNKLSCKCGYAPDRQEHLKRHEQSRKHLVDKAEMLPCKFDGCIDRKTGKQRTIAARCDNLKAHYTKTHFKYGNSENGGKNARKSMKAAHELDLHVYDYRWTLLLEGKEGKEGSMNLNHEIEGYLHVWKMLGYSILETRDTKVKDVLPDWPDNADEKLQKFDPRWKALWDGTLTYDKAIDKGKDMNESDAQGLLGVTMLETEAMGIKSLDPRWTEMDSGRMSVEQSEKLGVKQRNPVWIAKRRAR